MDVSLELQVTARHSVLASRKSMLQENLAPRPATNGYTVEKELVS